MWKLRPLLTEWAPAKISCEFANQYLFGPKKGDKFYHFLLLYLWERQTCSSKKFGRSQSRVLAKSRHFWMTPSPAFSSKFLWTVGLVQNMVIQIYWFRVIKLSKNVPMAVFSWETCWSTWIKYQTVASLFWHLSHWPWTRWLPSRYDTLSERIRLVRTGHILQPKGAGKARNAGDFGISKGGLWSLKSLPWPSWLPWPHIWLLEI